MCAADSKIVVEMKNNKNKAVSLSCFDKSGLFKFFKKFSLCLPYSIIYSSFLTTAAS